MFFKNNKNGTIIDKNEQSTELNKNSILYRLNHLIRDTCFNEIMNIPEKRLLVKKLLIK